MALGMRGMVGKARAAVPVGRTVRVGETVRVRTAGRVGAARRALSAARVSVAALIAALLSSGAVWAEDSLVDVVQAKNHDAAVALIAKGTDVHARSADGTTALQWAVYNDDVDLVERLIKAGA